MMNQDETFMRMAIELSKKAVEHGNEPFGSVLVKNNTVVYTNENQIHTQTDPTFHGETGLIRSFCHETGITDLHDYTLYTNCEPCFMCAGAIVWAKVGRLVYGASNIELERILSSSGSACSSIVFRHSSWRPQVTPGVCKEEAMKVLEAYFGRH